MTLPSPALPAGLQPMEKGGILLHLLRHHSKNVSPEGCSHPRTAQSSVHGCASDEPNWTTRAGFWCKQPHGPGDGVCPGVCHACSPALLQLSALCPPQSWH